MPTTFNLCLSCSKHSSGPQLCSKKQATEHTQWNLHSRLDSLSVCQLQSWSLTWSVMWVMLILSLFLLLGFTGSYSVFDIIALGLCNNVGVQFCPRRHWGMCWETVDCLPLLSLWGKRVLPPGKIPVFVSTISQSKCVTVKTPSNTAAFLTVKLHAQQHFV